MAVTDYSVFHYSWLLSPAHMSSPSAVSGWLLVSFTVYSTWSVKLKWSITFKNKLNLVFNVPAYVLCKDLFKVTFEALRKETIEHTAGYHKFNRYMTLSSNECFYHNSPSDVIHKRSGIYNVSYFCASPLKWLNVFWRSWPSLHSELLRHVWTSDWFVCFRTEHCPSWRGQMNGRCSYRLRATVM